MDPQHYLVLVISGAQQQIFIIWEKWAIFSLGEIKHWIWNDKFIEVYSWQYSIRSLLSFCSFRSIALWKYYWPPKIVYLLSKPIRNWFFFALWPLKLDVCLLKMFLHHRILSIMRRHSQISRISINNWNRIWCITVNKTVNTIAYSYLICSYTECQIFTFFNCAHFIDSCHKYCAIDARAY